MALGNASPFFAATVYAPPPRAIRGVGRARHFRPVANAGRVRPGHEFLRLPFPCNGKCLAPTLCAELLGVSKRTLEQWEQGRREPSGAAKTLIKLAALHPEVLRQLAA